MVFADASGGGAAGDDAGSGVGAGDDAGSGVGAGLGAGRVPTTPKFFSALHCLVPQGAALAIVVPSGDNRSTACDSETDPKDCETDSTDIEINPKNGRTIAVVGPGEILELDNVVSVEAAQCLGEGARPGRIQEFREGRLAAHYAIRMLGLRGGTETPWTQPILRGEHSLPVFPLGIVGSIAHTHGVRAALAGWEGEYRSIGIDVERAAPLPNGVAGVILREDEPYRGIPLNSGASIPFDTVVFSCKEAIYKAWFPLARRFLDFPEVRVELCDMDGRPVTACDYDPMPSASTGEIMPVVRTQMVPAARAQMVNAIASPEHETTLSLSSGGCTDRWGIFHATIFAPGAPFSEIHGRWVVADGLVWASALVPVEDAALSGIYSV